MCQSDFPGHRESRSAANKSLAGRGVVNYPVRSRVDVRISRVKLTRSTIDHGQLNDLCGESFGRIVGNALASNVLPSPGRTRSGDVVASGRGNLQTPLGTLLPDDLREVHIGPKFALEYRQWSSFA